MLVVSRYRMFAHLYVEHFLELLADHKLGHTRYHGPGALQSWVSLVNLVSINVLHVTSYDYSCCVDKWLPKLNNKIERC